MPPPEGSFSGLAAGPRAGDPSTGTAAPAWRILGTAPRRRERWPRPARPGSQSPRRSPPPLSPPASPPPRPPPSARPPLAGRERGRLPPTRLFVMVGATCRRSRGPASRRPPALACLCPGAARGSAHRGARRTAARRRQGRRLLGEMRGSESPLPEGTWLGPSCRCPPCCWGQPPKGPVCGRALTTCLWLAAASPREIFVSGRELFMPRVSYIGIFFFPLSLHADLYKP